jgi:hypothetical protein
MAIQQRLFMAGGIVLLLLATLGVAYSLTPPLFFSAGNHYFVASDIFTVGEVWRCDPPKTEDCVPSRESWLMAIAEDPNLLNWFPITVEVVPLD